MSLVFTGKQVDLRYWATKRWDGNLPRPKFNRVPFCSGLNQKWSRQPYKTMTGPATSYQHPTASQLLKAVKGLEGSAGTMATLSLVLRYVIKTCFVHLLWRNPFDDCTAFVNQISVPFDKFQHNNASHWRQPSLENLKFLDDLSFWLLSSQCKQLNVGRSKWTPCLMTLWLKFSQVS